MAKEKISRKELLKGTDEFMTISAKIVVFVREHIKQFQYIGVGICVVILVYLGLNTLFGFMNSRGQSAYNLAFQSAEKIIVPEPDKKEIEMAEKLFQEVIDDHGFSKAAKLATADLAIIKYREKKYDEAISLFTKFLEEIPVDSPYYTLARISLAACYEETGDFEKALDLLVNVKDSDGSNFKDQAMMGLARVYSLSGKPEKSIEILKGFVEQFKDSPYLPLAQARIEQLS